MGEKGFRKGVMFDFVLERRPKSSLEEQGNNEIREQRHSRGKMQHYSFWKLQIIETLYGGRPI